MDTSGRTGWYVDVTVVTPLSEDTIPIRDQFRISLLDPESDRVVRSGSIETGDLDPGQVKNCFMSCPMEDRRLYDIQVDMRHWWY